MNMSRRIRKPDIRQQLWSSLLKMPNTVAIGRGPYTSIQDILSCADLVYPFPARNHDEFT